MTALPVRQLTSREEIHGILRRDPIWTGYAIGDLDAGMFERCQWYSAGDALALIFHGLDFTPVFTVGSAPGIEAIFESAITLPSFYLNQRREQLPAVERFYTVHGLRPMWRMALESFHPSGDEVVPMGPEHLDELRALYRMEAGADGFARFQLDSGYFRGVIRDGALVSVAGVHLASRHYGVAAVGNVFTHPRHRGRGYGAQCTSAVVAALQADGIPSIILNVEQRNTGAIRIYERMGFTRYCEFFEGTAWRK